MTDVVVVGGGPAGLCAAIALARRGASVLVCERSHEPERKPCGEGLLPSAVTALLALGLRREELFAAGRALDGLRYVSPRGVTAETDLVEGAGLGLPRPELLRLLHELLTRTAGVQYVKAEARLTTVRGARHVRVGQELLSPRLIVGADGLGSSIRRDADLPFQLARGRRFGAREHFRIEPWSRRVEVHFGASAEAYVTPVADDLLNVAVLWSPGPARNRRGVPDVQRLFPALARRLAAAQRHGPLRGAGPFRVHVPRPAAEGLVLVGDAAGYLDPITGEGVGLAATHALLLARTLSDVFQRRGPAVITAAQLRPYLRAAEQSERDHRQLTRFVLLARRSPWLLERIIQTLAAEPRLLQHLCSANQGRCSPLSLPLGPLFKAVMARTRLAAVGDR